MKTLRERVKNLLNDPQPAKGTNQHNRGCDIITPSPRGTDPDYALRRLKRDRPDLAQRVLAGGLCTPGPMSRDAGFGRTRQPP